MILMRFIRSSTIHPLKSCPGDQSGLDDAEAEKKRQTKDQYFSQRFCWNTAHQIWQDLVPQCFLVVLWFYRLSEVHTYFVAEKIEAVVVFCRALIYIRKKESEGKRGETVKRWFFWWPLLNVTTLCLQLVLITTVLFTTSMKNNTLHTTSTSTHCSLIA